MEGGEEAWYWQMKKEIVWSVSAIVVSFMILIIWEKLWLKPQRIRSVLQKQGITGPSPSFPFGNLSQIKRIQSHFFNNNSLSSSSQPEQWFPSLFPFLQQWRKQYGSTFVFSTGHIQHLYIGDPKLIKELNRAKPMDLGRPTYIFKPLKPLLGSGILTVNGPPWSFQRNLIAPEFSLLKIQNMVDFMEESTKEIMRKWERIIEESGVKKMAEIVIDDYMKDLTADIISKACFSGSYAQGNQIFAKLTALQAAVAKPNMLFGFLYLRILPTKENKKIWKLEKEMEQLILKVVHHRKLQNQSHKDQNQKDLLQMILENTAYEADNSSGAWGMWKKLKHKRETQKLIVDICKNIYFAGSETTAVLLTWTLVLLCLHPQWQDRLRAEILEAYPNISPHCFHDMDKFRNMKQLSMVIQESLRLYGPAITTAREAIKKVKVGEMVVPKGTNILVFITAMHRDPEIWGEDANEFKPERFEGGVSNACKYPQAYLPFGIGSQICLGQYFAIIEAKIALILLLSNFSFSISPSYRHCPFYKLALNPKYGAPLLVTKL
ncbi:cytochrome P450 714A1-like [Prosopis cineraria]|uniref:cytochrome P450 714A1-like n=1 Tax=Prosopis cineraria TaxID=364024 RepID=UPI00240F433A|nr:cytochrome P450 714A1-like [Prosopis cineraria]